MKRITVIGHVQSMMKATYGRKGGSLLEAMRRWAKANTRRKCFCEAHNEHTIPNKMGLLAAADIISLSYFCGCKFITDPSKDSGDNMDEFIETGWVGMDK